MDVESVFGGDKDAPEMFILDLRVAIATWLECQLPDGKWCMLDPTDDLDVFLLPTYPKVSNQSPFGIVIDIETKAYPARVATRDERAREIRRKAEQLLPEGTSVAIWLKTVDASWPSESEDS